MKHYEYRSTYSRFLYQHLLPVVPTPPDNDDTWQLVGCVQSIIKRHTDQGVIDDYGVVFYWQREKEDKIK